MKYIITGLILSSVLTLTTPAHAGLLHDWKVWRHDKAKIEKVDSFIMKELDHLYPHHELSKLKRDEHKLHELSKLKKDECKRLKVEFLIRHPPGTKPESLKGSHGCNLWRQDAHWHDLHPQVISILGFNFSLVHL